MINKWIDDQHYSGISYLEKRLTQTEFNNCTFQNCDFSKADLSESDFVNCQFEECNFAMVLLHGTGIKDVLFTGCKLIGAGFDNCSDFLFSARFQQCGLDYASFVAKKIRQTRFEDCSMKEVDFSDADLSLAVFENCDLQNAVFSNTNIEKADFRSAYNYSINPEANRIKKARFSFPGIGGLLEKYHIEIE